jgi:molybdenum cofactor cytidylyltransferase
LVVKSLTNEYIAGFQKGIQVVRPGYMNKLGHPILIDNSLFSEFLDLEGDQGGKEIIKKYKSKTIILSFEHSFWGMDIDTVEDYQSSKNYL